MTRLFNAVPTVRGKQAPQLKRLRGGRRSVNEMNRIPVIDMTATGINITRLRVNAGLTVKDLQDIFGFSTPQAIYKWQRGTALPTVDNLVVLAAVFGVRIDDILIFQGCGVIQISA
jgi:DNA-binding XRE family transcriptional regulator